MHLHILVASPGLQILKDEIQDKLYDNANNISCERLAFALLSESSIQKCPYLAQHSTTQKEINSFASIARPAKGYKSLSKAENFKANFMILTDALRIADTVDLRYIKVIKKALERSLSDSTKGRIYY